MEWCRPKACLKVFCRYVVRPGSSGYVCYDAVKISGRVLEGAKVRNAQPYVMFRRRPARGPALRSFSTYVDLSGHSSSSEAPTYLPTYPLAGGLRPPNLPTYLPNYHYMYIVKLRPPAAKPTYLPQRFAASGRKKPTYLPFVRARADLLRSKKNVTLCADYSHIGHEWHPWHHMYM